jgi:acetyl esterase/lipase
MGRISHPRSRHAVWVLFAVVVALPGCRVTDVPLWRPTAPPAAGALQVERLRDVAYYEGKGADLFRHRLDLYLPKGKKDFPVIILVHGGAWMVGDNRCCGLYSSVGEFLASRGIGAVLPNYRLSPWVKHPEHMKDLARACAWTKSHIADHGGRADQIFIAGHSAGGHMAALLATDERYLKAEGLRGADLKGVIAVSGVYRIPKGKYGFALGGAGPDGLRLSDLTSMRGKGGPGPLAGSGISMRLNVFGPAFGDDPVVRADASPLSHVRAGLPPFLIFSAEHDLPHLAGMAEEFERALAARGCECRLHKIANRNHNSVMFRAVDLEDPVARQIVEFVKDLVRAR